MPWHNAPVSNKLAASQQGGSRGAQLWGVDFKGALHTVFQTTPGGDWGDWVELDLTGPNRARQVYELAWVPGRRRS